MPPTPPVDSETTDLWKDNVSSPTKKGPLAMLEKHRDNRDGKAHRQRHSFCLCGRLMDHFRKEKGSA